MQMIIGKPPIYEEATKLFQLPPDKAVVFTYGNIIYNPSGLVLPADLIRHEETHAEQQSHDATVAAIWWERYLKDPDFRLEQEAEAYGMQYKFICATIKDRNARARQLWELAKMLSSPMYGSIINHTAAINKILDYAKGRVMHGIEELMPE